MKEFFHAVKFQNDEKRRRNNPTGNNQYERNIPIVKSHIGIGNIHEYTKRKGNCGVYCPYVERECMMSTRTIDS